MLSISLEPKIWLIKRELDRIKERSNLLIISHTDHEIIDEIAELIARKRSKQ